MGEENKAKVQEYVAMMRDDLAYLFDERDIDAEVQASISFLNYRSLNRFALLGRSIEQVMDFCKDDIGIPLSREGRAMTSAVCDAWEAAQKRKRARDDQEAEAAAGKLPRCHLDGEHVILRKSLFKHFYKGIPLENDEIPSATWIDSRLAEIEKGELIAESLEYSLSVEDAGEGGPDSDWIFQPNHFTGKNTLSKVIKKIPMPTNTEELRKVYRLMGRHWTMAAMKQPNRPYLNGLHPDALEPHLLWLIGKEVLQLECKVKGVVVAVPYFELMLSFELELRKWALKQMQLQSWTLIYALEKARENTDLRQRHFLTPLSLGPRVVTTVSQALAPMTPWGWQPPAPYAPPKMPALAPPLALTDPTAASIRAAAKRERQKAKKVAKAAGRAPGPPPATPQQLAARSAGAQQQNVANQQLALHAPPPPPPLAAAGAKGKGKGAAAGTNVRQNTTTSDGTPICFRFQRGKCPGNCGRAHVCQRCFGAHPETSCPSRP